MKLGKHSLHSRWKDPVDPVPKGRSDKSIENAKHANMTQFDGVCIAKRPYGWKTLGDMYQSKKQMMIS